MIAAGLVAKKAVERGLKVPPHVKTSLSPGLARRHRLFRQSRPAGISRPARLQTTGYGCMTCIGNSGPLPEPIAHAVEQSDLVVAVGALGQSQFRRPNQPAREGELSRLAAAGRRVCAGGHDRHQHHGRADRQERQGREGLSSRTSGRRSRKCTTMIAASHLAGDVPQAIRQRRREERAVERDPGQGRRAVRLR